MAEPTRPFFQRRFRLLSALLLGVLLLSAAYVQFRPKDKGGSVAEAPFLEPKTVEAPIEEVAGVSDLPGSRLVLAERVVTSVDENGDNRYHTRILATDRAGTKRTTVYESDAWTYETMAMLGSGSVAVFPETEDGATVIDLDGKAQSASVPPYRYLGWLPSPDGTSVAVAEADEAEDGTGADRLILWDRASGERRTIPVDLQSVDIGEPPSFLVPLAFDTAKKNLYLQARQSLDDDFAGFALLRIDLDAGSSEVLLTQSEEETSPRRLVSIAPDLDFALFERQSPDSADDTERAPDLDIEAFSLADRAFSLWFSQAGVQAPAIPATSPLSPDGRFLALESSDLEHPGVLFWDAKEKKLIRMTESGGFLGWTPDGQNMLVEEILQNEGEETSQYQVQSIDRESRELTTVFRYNDVSEGGGMNAKGDTFFQLIGISS